MKHRVLNTLPPQLMTVVVVGLAVVALLASGLRYLFQSAVLSLRS